MTTSEWARRVPLAVEVAVAVVVGAAAFALVAVIVAVAESDVLVAVVGLACIAVVVAISRRWGIAYAAPAAIASLVAYDWFQFPPTHPRAFPDPGDLATLLAYIAGAVLIGELAAHAGRRADVTEAARSELADEQAALRRVATLVARGASPDAVFAAVAEEVGELLGVDGARVVRYSGDDEVVQLAGWSAPGYDPPALGRAKLEPTSLAGEVFRTGRVARIDDYKAVDRMLPRPVPRAGARSGVGAPIVVDGRLWGAMAAWLMHPEPLPDTAEERLADFTELIATAISNTASHEELARLADEQAALRRVATLVARGAAPAEVFAVTATEVGRLLGANATALCRYEPDATVTVLALEADVEFGVGVGARITLEGENAMGAVFRTGRSARQDSFEATTGTLAEIARQGGMGTSVGAPIVVEGRLWGVVVVSSRGRALPADAEQRLGDFGELVATTIANAESRAALGQVSDQQAALRRVATLVAQAAPPDEVFTAVADELGRLLGADFSGMIRYEDDGSVSPVATWAAVGEHPPVPDRWPTEPGDPTRIIAETRQPARVEDWAAVPGPIAAVIREELGVSSSVGCPIVVEGRLWGALAVHSKQRTPLPPDTETRTAQFADLVATAIANAEARAEVTRLAQEQAALRRVATLVAQGVRPAEIFSAVSDEVGRLFGQHAGVVRFESEGPAIVFVGVGKSLEGLPVGTRWELDDSMASAEVYRTGHSARVDAVDWSSRGGSVAEAGQRLGVVSTVASPIIVEGRRWGAMTVSSMDEPLPLGVEERLENFIELVATAIANAESREARGRLTDEQAALRRVATLVADGASPTAVFDAVAAEMERLLDADRVALGRYEAGAEITVVAHRGVDAWRLPPGSRVSHEGETLASLVRRTERPTRIEELEQTDDATAEAARAFGGSAGVGAPIVVDGRLWGVIAVSWHGGEPPRADTEERMAQFAELLDTAIANADSRDQLTASRARLLTEADEARRRVVRDLHDGAQQRLVHTIITLKLAQRALQQNDKEAESLVGEALGQAERGNEDLRELAHGILPAVLTGGGLRAGVDAVVLRLGLPVRVDVPAERFPAEIEASAYFIVAEALTNVVKHAHAKRAEVRAAVEDGVLHVEIRDDGIGGADPGGHGLVGIGDRVTALGGRLEIESPAGGGTLLAATLPLSAG